MDTQGQTQTAPWLRRNDFAPYEPGQGDAGSDVVRLSANENPRGPSPHVADALLNTIRRGLGVYPHDGAPALRNDIAKQLQLPPSQVYPAAGSAGVIKTIAERTLQPGAEVIVSSLTFPYYEIAAAQQGARSIRVPVRADMSDDLQAMLSSITRHTRALFLASPNNPTGMYVPEATLRAFLRSIPRDIVVGLDLAYIEYADSGYANCGTELLEEHANLVLLRTFSKVHGLASLRIGYGVARTGTVAQLEKAAIPFSISGPASVAGRAALADNGWVEESAKENRVNRAFLSEALSTAGMAWYPSQANFLLVRFDKIPAMKVWDLLRARKIYTRPVRGAPNYLRVTVGTRSQCELFAKAVNEICGGIQ